LAYQSKDGKNNNSKFRANRRDKAAQDGMKSVGEGNKAQANKIEGKGQKSPESREEKSKPAPVSGGAGDNGGPVNEGAQGTMAAKAKEVHITHDDNSGHHHVHTVMDNGMEEHSDHPSREEAHYHGAMSAGAGEGNYPMQHEPPDGEAPDADDYEVEPLDQA